MALIDWHFRLACSYFTHALLAAYWVQSELGDWDLYHAEMDAGGGEDGGDVSYLSELPLTVGDDESDDQWFRPMSEQVWTKSITGPPYPPPLVRFSTSFLQHVAHFHRKLR